MAHVFDIINKPGAQHCILGFDNGGVTERFFENMVNRLQYLVVDLPASQSSSPVINLDKLRSQVEKVFDVVVGIGNAGVVLLQNLQGYQGGLKLLGFHGYEIRHNLK